MDSWRKDRRPDGREELEQSGENSEPDKGWEDGSYLQDQWIE